MTATLFSQPCLVFFLLALPHRFEAQSVNFTTEGYLLNPCIQAREAIKYDVTATSDLGQQWLGKCIPGAGTHEWYDCWGNLFTSGDCVFDISKPCLTSLHNGICNFEFDCAEYNYDGGDCDPAISPRISLPYDSLFGRPDAPEAATHPNLEDARTNRPGFCTGYVDYPIDAGVLAHFATNFQGQNDITLQESQALQGLGYKMATGVLQIESDLWQLVGPAKQQLDAWASGALPSDGSGSGSGSGGGSPSDLKPEFVQLRDEFMEYVCSIFYSPASGPDPRFETSIGRQRFAHRWKYATLTDKPQEGGFVKYIVDLLLTLPSFHQHAAEERSTGTYLLFIL